MKNTMFDLKAENSIINSYVPGVNSKAVTSTHGIHSEDAAFYPSGYICLLDQRFSTGDSFASQDTFGNVWRHFYYHQKEVEVPLGYRHRTVIPLSLPTKGYLVQNISSTK